MESGATRKRYAVCCAEANKKNPKTSGASPGGFTALPELPENVPGEFSTPHHQGMADRIEVQKSVVKKRLKWPFTEKENETYLTKLERFKGTLNLASDILQS